MRTAVLIKIVQKNEIDLSRLDQRGMMCRIRNWLELGEYR